MKHNDWLFQERRKWMNVRLVYPNRLVRTVMDVELSQSGRVILWAKGDKDIGLVAEVADEWKEPVNKESHQVGEPEPAVSTIPMRARGRGGPGPNGKRRP